MCSVFHSAASAEPSTSVTELASLQPVDTAVVLIALLFHINITFWRYYFYLPIYYITIAALHLEIVQNCNFPPQNVNMWSVSVMVFCIDNVFPLGDQTIFAHVFVRQPFLIGQTCERPIQRMQK